MQAVPPPQPPLPLRWAEAVRNVEAAQQVGCDSWCIMAGDMQAAHAAGALTSLFAAAALAPASSAPPPPCTCNPTRTLSAPTRFCRR